MSECKVETKESLRREWCHAHGRWQSYCLREQVAEVEKREERLAKWTRYYFGANELKCEVSIMKDCDECAVCRVWAALNRDPEKKGTTTCPKCEHIHEGRCKVRPVGLKVETYGECGCVYEE